MNKSDQSKLRAQTSIRCGGETFVFRYDVDVVSMKALGNKIATMVLDNESAFSLIAAYRVMQHVDQLLREIDSKS